MTGSGVSRFQRNAEGLGGATCAKLIWFRAAPGRHDEYSAYLHDHVEPIDHEAVREGALLDMITLLRPSLASARMLSSVHNPPFVQSIGWMPRSAA